MSKGRAGVEFQVRILTGLFAVRKLTDSEKIFAGLSN
jgi:hypothetical protein